MSDGNGLHFASKVSGVTCRGTEANLAVPVKPNFSVKSSSIFSREDLSTAINAGVVRLFVLEADSFPASTGPPPKIHPANSKTTVLRI